MKIWISWCDWACKMRNVNLLGQFSLYYSFALQRRLLCIRENSACRLNWQCSSAETGRLAGKLARAFRRRRREFSTPTFDGRKSCRADKRRAQAEKLLAIAILDPLPSGPMQALYSNQGCVPLVTHLMKYCMSLVFFSSPTLTNVVLFLFIAHFFDEAVTTNTGASPRNWCISDIADSEVVN